MAPRQPITPPPPSPPRFSLVRSAPAAGIPEDALYAGWRFMPELCPDDSAGGVVMVDCLGSAEDPLSEGVGAVTEQLGQSFMVYVAQTCSTVGNLGRDWQARLRRQMAAEESYYLARQLAVGGFALDQDSLNETGTDVIGSGGLPASIALAALEDELAERLRGQLGQIHVPFSILTLLIVAGAIRFDLGQWYSPAGHLVIVDAGYTGTAPGSSDTTPADDAVYMYGTSSIRVQLGEVQTIPAQAEADGSIPAEAVERDVNTVVIRAGRLATYVWDECVHVGIAVDTTVDPLGGGAAGGGGGGDATAANQALAIAVLENLDIDADDAEVLLAALGSNTDQVEAKLDSLIALANPTLVVEPFTADEAIAAANFFHGYSLWNTNAGITEITFHDGVSSAGTVIGRLRLAEDESTGVIVFPKRLPCSAGLHVEVVSGAAVGSVYYEA